MMKTKQLLAWCAAFIFWGLGLILLWRVWSYQESLSDPLASYIQFAIMFLATFYPLVFLPVKRRVDRLFTLIVSPDA